jgi:hypothetical protein
VCIGLEGLLQALNIQTSNALNNKLLLITNTRNRTNIQQKRRDAQELHDVFPISRDLCGLSGRLEGGVTEQWQHTVGIVHLVAAHIDREKGIKKKVHRQ